MALVPNQRDPALEVEAAQGMGGTEATEGSPDDNNGRLVGHAPGASSIFPSANSMSQRR